MSLGQTLPVPIPCHLGAELTPRRKDLWHAVVQLAHELMASVMSIAGRLTLAQSTLFRCNGTNSGAFRGDIVCWRLLPGMDAGIKLGPAQVTRGPPHAPVC
jgi:hypothetical protein